MPVKAPTPDELSKYALRGQKVVTRLFELGAKHSQRQLARDAGLDKSTLANWLKIEDVRSDPRTDWEKGWTDIALVLGVDKSYLLDNSQPVKRFIASTNPKTGIRKYSGSAFLGLFKHPIPELDVNLPRWPTLPADENWEVKYRDADIIEGELVPNIFGRTGPSDAERIVAPVTGRSMEPRLFNGDLAIVELCDNPEPGRIVLAKSSKGTTLKVLRTDGSGRRFLHSLNPDDQEPSTERWEVLGVLVGIIRKSRESGLVEWNFGGLGA